MKWLKLKEKESILEKKNCEELAVENQSKATKLIAKSCFDSNAETDEKHGNSSRLQVPLHISPTDDGERAYPSNTADDAGSENNLELNDRLLEGKKY